MICHRQTPTGGDTGDLLKMSHCHQDSPSESPTYDLSYLNVKESTSRIPLAGHHALAH